jgi:Kelch motif
MGRRAIYRTLAVALAAGLGAVLLSGSDQPVTARSYDHWQALPSPPLTARTHALGVAVRHRVLVLGGHRASGPALRDGAAYDLRTGSWAHLWMPVALSDRDAAVTAGGIVIVRHDRAGREATWWRYDVRQDGWSRMRSLPPGLSTPCAFGSEVYAISRRLVEVYSVQLGRWTALPADPRRPVLVHPTVTASRHGTVVTGHTRDRPHRSWSDRWDGVRWHRSHVTRPESVTAAPDGATRVRLGGRTLVVRDARAWIRLP